MTDRYKSRASTRADGCGKWYIVDVVVREKIHVEVSNGEDEYDAKEIALGESRLFRQTEKDFEVQVDIEPAANECLEREMRYAHLVIPMWDGGESRGTQQDRGHGHYECAVGQIGCDEALLRQALEALGRYCKRPKGADFTMEVEEFRLYATEVMGLPAPANRAGLIEPTRSFAISAQQQDKLDAERWRYIRRKLCLTGNGDGTCAMQAINLPAAIHGWPEPGQVAEFCDAAIDAAMRKEDSND